MVAYCRGPYCVLADDDTLQLQIVSQRLNRMTDEVVSTVKSAELPFKNKRKDAPSFLKLSGQGDNVYLAWNDGTTLRFDVSDFEKPRLAEEVDLVADNDAQLTALAFMVGRNTLVAGVFALLNTGLYWLLKPVLNLATFGAFAFLMPLVINGVLLLATLKVVRRRPRAPKPTADGKPGKPSAERKPWLHIEGLLATAWLAVVLTIAHGVLWVAVDYLPTKL